MRKTLVLICVVAAALVTSGTVAASVVQVGPTDVNIPATWHDYYSGVCGFDVYWQLSGTVRTTLVLDKDGVVVSQIDTSPNMLYTLTAPSKGTELAIANSITTHYTYPEGATLGAPVEVSMTGFNDKYPGLTAQAGLQLYSGHVTGFIGQVPQWDGVWGGAEWIDRLGKWYDPSLVVASICDTLGDT